MNMISISFIISNYVRCVYCEKYYLIWYKLCNNFVTIIQSVNFNCIVIQNLIYSYANINKSKTRVTDKQSIYLFYIYIYIYIQNLTQHLKKSFVEITSTDVVNV